MEAMTAKEVKQLISDIRDIKIRLCGNPDLQEQGFIQETNEKLSGHDTKIEKLFDFKSEQEKLRIRIAGIIVGSTFTFTALFTGIAWLITYFMKLRYM
jgi:hypothetical protein